MDAAKSLIAKAFAAWSDVDSKTKAEAAFNEALIVCEKPKTSPECWSILKEALKAYDGPSAIMPLQLALDLVNKNNLSEIPLALEMLSRAEKHIKEQGPSTRNHRSEKRDLRRF